jgi:hypothetical protein
VFEEERTIPVRDHFHLERAGLELSTPEFATHFGQCRKDLGLKLTAQLT